jgi:guanosine-3',5'-bis(diphosphate) 3'-pyrophosphohydrolase
MMIFEEKELMLILQAVKFAAQKHRNQRRKGQGATPYINHPIEVVETLWRVGQVRDVPTLVAAILHDIIEDTETSPAELEALFGPEVVALVQEVSDDKSLPKARRKQLQIEHAPHISKQAKEIKLADKISNIYDVSHAPPVDWPHQRVVEYLDWAEKVVAGLRGANPELEAHFDETLRESRELVAGGRQ